MKSGSHEASDVRLRCGRSAENSRYILPEHIRAPADTEESRSVFSRAPPEIDALRGAVKPPEELVSPKCGVREDRNNKEFPGAHS